MIGMSPPNGGFAITPADTDLTGGPIRAVYVGGAGNVAVKFQSGQSVVFTAPPVGTVLWGKFIQVKSTGTTATNLVGLY